MASCLPSKDQRPGNILMLDPYAMLMNNCSIASSPAAESPMPTADHCLPGIIFSAV